MAWDEEDDDTIYEVIQSRQGQYTLWLADREVPSGWKPLGFRGKGRQCLDRIEEVWTDMPPRRLRQEVEALHRRISR